MNDKLVDLAIAKIIQEYNFLKTDEEYKKELINQHQGDFLKIVNDEIGKIDQNLLKKHQDVNPQQHKTIPKIDVESISHNDKVKLKKIYREIVKLTHPDKVNDVELNELYTLATIAYDEYDLFDLYFIAKDLKIHFKLTLEEGRILNDLIQVKKDEITKIERSFIWLWMSSPNQEEKDRLVNSFISSHYL